MENVLKSQDGVVNAKADYVKGLATISYDPARITPDQMVEAINTKTFFQASLPPPEDSTPQASNDLKLQPYIIGGVMILLISVIIWQSRGRRPGSQTEVTGSSQE